MAMAMTTYLIGAGEYCSDFLHCQSGNVVLLLYLHFTLSASNDILLLGENRQQNIYSTFNRQSHIYFRTVRAEKVMFQTQ